MFACMHTCASKERFGTMRTLKKSALIMGVLLAIIGITLIVSTIQREVFEEDTEYHMTPITVGGRWRSINPSLTFIGAILLIVGISIILFALVWIITLEFESEK